MGSLRFGVRPSKDLTAFGSQGFVFPKGRGWELSARLLCADHAQLPFLSKKKTQSSPHAGSDLPVPHSSSTRCLPSPGITRATERLGAQVCTNSARALWERGGSGLILAGGQAY